MKTLVCLRCLIFVCAGKNGRPNLTASNGKIASTSNENTNGYGVKHITGPDGTKWVCLL